MVENSAAVVFYTGLDIGGKAWDIYNKLFQRPMLELRILAQSVVQIVNVGLQVPLMMQMHCFFINIRLHGMISVWQWSIDKFVVFVHISDPVFFIICLR